MAVNKVVYAGRTLIDLMGDNVTPETLAEGSIAHDSSGNVIYGTAAVVKRTPYFFDDADLRWYDNSEGLWEPDYEDMPCPHCGAKLQAYNTIDDNSYDTYCPACDGAITVQNGRVDTRTEYNNGIPYYYDVLDDRWVENYDYSWAYPDYIMSCPHCGKELQSSCDIDGNPRDTYCPHCSEPITLENGVAKVQGGGGGGGGSLPTCGLYVERMSCNGAIKITYSRVDEYGGVETAQHTIAPGDWDFYTEDCIRGSMFTLYVEDAGDSYVGGYCADFIDSYVTSDGEAIHLFKITAGLGEGVSVWA